MNILNIKVVRNAFGKYLLIIGLLLLSTSAFSQIATLTVSDADASESVFFPNPGQFQVTLTNGFFPVPALERRINVIVEVTTTTALAGTDRSSIDGVLIIPSGQTIGFINLDVLDDTLVEGNEILFLTLLDGDDYSVNPFASSTRSITILDDDFATLSIADVSADEGDGLVFTISSDKPVQYNHNVTVNFSGGTATPGGNGLTFPQDYNANAQSVIIPAGVSSQQFTVPTLNDNVIEPDETFNVTLASSTNANVIAGDTAEGEIVNDDFGQVIVVADRPTVNEDGSGQNGRFQVQLSEDNTTGSDIVVSYAITGTATSGDDFTALTGSVTFSNNQDSKNINVSVLDDALFEGNETVVLTLTNVSGSFYTLGTPISDTVTIIDDDVFRATITATDPDATEANPVTDTGIFTVSLDEINTTGNPITVNYTVTGTAESGTDFTALSGTVSILNNQRAATVTVTPINDNLVENAETVIVTLDAGTGYDTGNLASRRDIVTIADTDTFNASIVSTITTANESPISNGVFTIDVGSVNTTGSPITVNYTVAGTATPGIDYTVLSGTVSILDGQRTRVVTVSPLNDTVIENNETVILTLAAGNAYTISTPNTATITIISDDANIARITASDATAAESNTTVSTGEFTISLSAPNTTGSPLTVNYIIAGSAANTTDYATINTNTIVIPNGGQSARILITPVNDQIQEGTENVVITLAAGTGYVLGPQATRSAIVVINDNDQASLRVAPVTVNEDVASGNLLFDVILDIAVVGGTTVSYSFADDTAIGGGTDYTGTAGSLTFTGTANETRTISVPIVNDQLLENTETFTMQLGLPTNGVQRTNGGTAIGTINDDDNCVAAPILDTSVSAAFCVVDSNSTFSANLFDFTSTPAPSGTVLTWSLVSNPLTLASHLTPAQAQNVSTQASYYGFFYDATNNCASGTIEVQIVSNIIPQLESVTGNERCGPGTLLLSADPSDGASINWYDTLTSTTPITSGNTFTTPVLSATRSYFVEATENGCVTPRLQVIARIGVQASTGTAINASTCNVFENGPTILDLDDRLIGEGAGVWSINTDPSQTILIPSSNIIDFRDLVAGDYIFTFTTTNSTLPCQNASVDVTISVSDCETDDDGDGLFGGQEATLGTDPNNSDTDGDGINDGVEVGNDIANPLDEDSDGIIDALESTILDADNDGVADQQDPANDNACIPNRQNGVCDFDGDEIPDVDEIANGSDPDNPCDPNPEHPNCLPIDLEVTKSVDRIDAAIGETVVFTITLNNLDPNRGAIEVIVGDLLGLSFEYVSDIPSIGSYSVISGEWTIPQIAELGTETLQITATVTEEGDYSNTAELLTSLPIDENPNNNSATVQLNVDLPEGIDLAVEKTVDARNPLVGDEITFTITVLNQSQNGETIANIQIEEILDQGDNADYDIVTILEDNLGTYDLNAGLWTIPSLSIQQQAILLITVRVRAEVIFANTASLISSSPRDSDPSNNVGIAEVNVSLPTLEDPGFLFNQFSPNGDGTNDFLKINRDDKDITSNFQVDIQYNIVIYDRYGNEVFQKQAFNDTEIWDGTYNGKEVPKGTYFYIMNYDIGSGPTIDKGWIQLIR